MENVTIVISQEGTTIATLLTNTNGDANTTLNAGNYTVTFTYPNRNPYSTTINIAYDDTMLIFAFPGTPIGVGGNLTSTATLTQTGDIIIAVTPQIFGTAITISN